MSVVSAFMNRHKSTAILNTYIVFRKPQFYCEAFLKNLKLQFHSHSLVSKTSSRSGIPNLFYSYTPKKEFCDLASPKIYKQELVFKRLERNLFFNMYWK